MEGNVANLTQINGVDWIFNALWTSSDDSYSLRYVNGFDITIVLIEGTISVVQVCSKYPGNIYFSWWTTSQRLVL